MGVLGIIAGGGEAPKRLIAACRRLNRPFHVIALHGQTDEDIGADGAPVNWLHLGEAEALRNIAVEKSIKEVVMLGRMRRPALSEIKPDALALQKLVRVAPFFLAGDDALLKAIAREFEEEGYPIISAHSVFTDLLMPKGALGRVMPDDVQLIDIALGVQEARKLGEEDIGQAVVVQHGAVLAREDAEGTDALIRRASSLKQAGGKPVLVKMKKPQQDPRFDLPSLGVDTVKEAVAAGFAGIAAEAGASLLIDCDEVVRLADEAGLFILGVE